jgi:hypothetical protein
MDVPHRDSVFVQNNLRLEKDGQKPTVLGFVAPLGDPKIVDLRHAAHKLGQLHRGNKETHRARQGRVRQQVD